MCWHVDFVGEWLRQAMNGIPPPLFSPTTQLFLQTPTRRPSRPCSGARRLSCPPFQPRSRTCDCGNVPTPHAHIPTESPSLAIPHLLGSVHAPASEKKRPSGLPCVLLRNFFPHLVIVFHSANWHSATTTITIVVHSLR